MVENMDVMPGEPTARVVVNARTGTVVINRNVRVTAAAVSHGTISVSVAVTNSAAAQNVGTLTLASFINPAGLEPRGQNLYAETAASGTPTAGAAGSNGLGPLMQGYVETSNVNVVQELVTMIQTQRAYEMNSKAIQTADQMLQKLGQL
jgi:flagellar basal-body rod protein FlgG